MCILSADEPEEVARAAAVRTAWPAVRFATAIHPHRAGGHAGRVGDAVRLVGETADAVKAVALGEMGLDYHYDFAPRDVQREVFSAQAALAIERGLPIVVHTREASADTFAILREAGPALRGVMHCFSGTADDARQALELGFYLSFSGILTFPKAGDLRDIARGVPEDRVLVETDAPFLAPVPYRGKRNEPAWVAKTLEALAEVRGLSSAALGARVAQNFAEFIGETK